MPPLSPRMLALGIALATIQTTAVPAQTNPSPSPSPSGVGEVVPLRVTSELEAAAINVDVSTDVGTTRGIGLVLKPSSFSRPVDGDALIRLAAVQLEVPEGTSAPQVGSAVAVRRLQVRNLESSRILVRQGVLVHYEATNQTGLVRFSETFPYRLDGCTLPGTAPVAAALTILGDIVDLKPATASGSSLQLSDGDPDTSSRVCLDARGDLAGFGVRQADGAWRFSAFQAPEIDTSSPRFVPAFDPAAPTKPAVIHEYRVPAFLSGELIDPLAMANSIHILYRDARQPNTPPATSSEAWQVSQPALAGATFDQVQYKDGAIRFALPNLGSQPVKLEKALELQLIFLNQREGIIYRSPIFGAMVERKGAATYVRLQGLPQVSPAPAVAAQAPDQPRPAAGAVELTSESPLEYGMPVLGGAEVLFKLAQAPHWKRLSLRDRQWMEFPRTLDLSKLELAGNRDALFTLNRETRELQKLHPTTMEKQAALVLPEGRNYLAISAGASSAAAPIAVITSKGVMAVSPETLEPLGTGVLGMSGSISFARALQCQSSGDGVSLHLSSAALSPSSSRDSVRFAYHGPALGFVADQGPAPDLLAAASHLIRWTRSPDRFQLPYAASKEKPVPEPAEYQVAWSTPFAAAPLYLAVRADPLQPQQMYSTHTGHVCSLYSHTPLWSFPMPEAVQISDTSYRAFFDPESLTLAIWSHPTGLTLRTMDRQALKLAAPVLLNAPEPVVKAGSSYVFTPKVLGPAGWKLSVAGGPAEAKVDDQGTLRWIAASVPGGAGQSLKLQLTAAAGAGADGSAALSNTTSMSFPLLVDDAKSPVTAITASLSVQDAVNMIKRATPGATLPVPIVTIESRLVRSEKRILNVLPGLNDYVLVRAEGGSLVLLSPEDGRVLGSYSPPIAALVLPAGDCLFIFDSINQTINRIELPAMNVVKTVALPRSGSLLGIGAGQTPDGPVSLVISGMSLQAGVPTGMRLPPNTLSLLDRQTLSPGAWATFSPPPRASAKLQTTDPPRSLLDTGASMSEVSSGRLPPFIPTSRDGRILFLSSGQVITSASLTTGIPGETSGVDSVHPGWRTLAAPTGDRISHDGTLLAGRSHTEVPAPECEFSSCGLYYARQTPGDKSAEITLYSSDGMRPLFHITNVETYRLPNGSIGNLARRVAPMGDKNLIVAIHRMGYDMQFIKVDVPATYRQTNPQSAIVTSRISPFVAEGRTMQYQVTTNNPDAVSGFKLRQPVAGASISREGLFTYKAPAQLVEPVAQQIIVEVLLKSGAAVVHEFPIWVVPLPKSLKKGI